MNNEFKGQRTRKKFSCIDSVNGVIQVNGKNTQDLTKEELREILISIGCIMEGVRIVGYKNKLKKDSCFEDRDAVGAVYLHLSDDGEPKTFLDILKYVIENEFANFSNEANP